MVSLFNIQSYDDILLPMIKTTKFGVHHSFSYLSVQHFLVLNSGVKDSLKKFSLLLRQAKMVFVIIWFFDHFTLEYVPSVKSIWVITPADLFHAWITKLKLFFLFFKLSIFSPNKVICAGLLTILFNETQYVVKTRTAGYFSVSYEVINLFIKPQNFLLMGLYLIVFLFDSLLMFFLCFYIPFLLSHFTKVTASGLLGLTTKSIKPSKSMKILWGFFFFLRERVRPPASRSDLGWV